MTEFVLLRLFLSKLLKVLETRITIGNFYIFNKAFQITWGN